MYLLINSAIERYLNDQNNYTITRSKHPASSLNDSVRKRLQRPQLLPCVKPGVDDLSVANNLFNFFFQCINVSILLRHYFKYLGIDATVINGSLLGRWTTLLRARRTQGFESLLIDLPINELRYLSSVWQKARSTCNNCDKSMQ